MVFGETFLIVLQLTSFSVFIGDLEVLKLAPFFTSLEREFMNNRKLTRSLPEILLWLLRKRCRMRVSGNSMLPLLKPGEEILIDSQAYQNTTPRIGDIVIARHPQKLNLKIVKRVICVLENGDCLLQGDNPQESTDSRGFGAVKKDYILGRVTSRFG